MDHGKLARLHGALANEVRLLVIDLVSQHNEMCLCELVDLMGMSQANLSRHVSVLRDAEILRDRKVGTWVLELGIEKARIYEYPEGNVCRTVDAVIAALPDGRAGSASCSEECCTR